ncbi:hypothetical protein Tco_1574222 [Tanacetum coccineum]
MSACSFFFYRGSQPSIGLGLSLLGNGELGSGEGLAVSGTWEVVWARNRGKGWYEKRREAGKDSYGCTGLKGMFGEEANMALTLSSSFHFYLKPGLVIN